MPTRYDIWRTAAPTEWEREDECCEECFSPSHDTNFGRGEVAIPDGCKDDDCSCHWTDKQWREAKGEAKFDADRDDALTGD